MVLGAQRLSSQRPGEESEALEMLFEQSLEEEALTGVGRKGILGRRTHVAKAGTRGGMGGGGGIWVMIWVNQR